MPSPLTVDRERSPGVPEFVVDEPEVALQTGVKCQRSLLAEVYGLIQRHHQEKARLRKAQEEQERRQDRLLAELATEIFGLGKYLERVRPRLARAGLGQELQGLELQQAKLMEILQAHGVEIIDLTGQPLDLEKLEQVEVLSYLTRPGLKVPVVLETRSPIVYRQGRLIQAGVVIAGKPQEGQTED